MTTRSAASSAESAWGTARASEGSRSIRRMRRRVSATLDSPETALPSANSALRVTCCTVEGTTCPWIVRSRPPCSTASSKPLPSLLSAVRIRLPRLCPAVSASPSNRKSKSRASTGSPSDRAMRQLRMSPEAGRRYSRRRRPVLPPSSATVTIAVSRRGSIVRTHAGPFGNSSAFNPRSTTGNPVPPPRATTWRLRRRAAVDGSVSSQAPSRMCQRQLSRCGASSDEGLVSAISSPDAECEWGRGITAAPLEQGLRHDDDVPGQQRDVRIGAGITLNRIDVHANPLLGALGRAVAAARVADERDARGRGELAEASRHRDQLHERERLGAGIGAGLDHLAHDEHGVLHLAALGHDDRVLVPDHEVLREVAALDEPAEVDGQALGARSEEHTSELQSH